MTRFGNILKTHGVSGYKLAKDSGVSQSLIASFVSGLRDPMNMSLTTAQRLSEAIGITVNELLEAIK